MKYVSSRKVKAYKLIVFGGLISQQKQYHVTLFTFFSSISLYFAFSSSRSSNGVRLHISSFSITVFIHRKKWMLFLFQLKFLCVPINNIFTLLVSYSCMEFIRRRMKRNPLRKASRFSCVCVYKRLANKRFVSSYQCRHDWYFLH